jgi:peptidoglycan/LPS O-acetylase OafA/YrhL
MSDRRERGLDLLRGVAALSVVLFHLWLYARPQPSAAVHGAIDALWSAGRLGLVLFFVLSGYLLYRPWVLARRGEARRPGLATYLRCRTARVLPAYYLALGGSILLLAGAAGTPGVRLAPPEHLVLFALFAQNLSAETIMKLDPPMWTLAVEVGFYLVLPLLSALMMRTRRPVAVPLLAIGAGLAYNWAIAGDGLSQPWTKALPALLPLFGVGMLIAHLPAGGFGRRARWPLVGLAAILVAGDAAWHQQGAGVLGLVVRDLPAAAGFALLIVGVRHADPARNLIGRGLAWVGTVSFGLYLWHVPVIWSLRSVRLLPLDPVAALPLVLALSLGLAAGSWYLVEQPMMRIVRVGARRSRPGAGTLPGAVQVP